MGDGTLGPAGAIFHVAALQGAIFPPATRPERHAHQPEHQGEDNGEPHHKHRGPPDPHHPGNYAADHPSPFLVERDKPPPHN